MLLPEHTVALNDLLQTLLAAQFAIEHLSKLPAFEAAPAVKASLAEAASDHRKQANALEQAMRAAGERPKQRLFERDLIKDAAFAIKAELGSSERETLRQRLEQREHNISEALATCRSARDMPRAVREELNALADSVETTRKRLLDALSTLGD